MWMNLPYGRRQVHPAAPWCRPFFSEKYDITKHPNYKYLSDFDKRNAFDIERFLSVKLKPKPDEVYEDFEVDLSGDAAS